MILAYFWRNSGLSWKDRAQRSFTKRQTFGASSDNEWTCKSVKKDTPTQVFSYEYYEIFKNSFFYRTSLVVASGIETFFLVCDAYKFNNLWR